MDLRVDDQHLAYPFDPKMFSGPKIRRLLKYADSAQSGFEKGVPRTDLAADLSDRFGRINDRGAGVAAEGEEICIADDDQIGSRCGCEGQHRVVRAIGSSAPAKAADR